MQGGVLFGTAGVKILSSRGRKESIYRVYGGCAAGKGLCDENGHGRTGNAEDILAEAQQINEERAAQEAEAVRETEKDGADPSDEGTM